MWMRGGAGQIRPTVGQAYLSVYTTLGLRTATVLLHANVPHTNVKFLLSAIAFLTALAGLIGAIFKVIADSKTPVPPSSASAPAQSPLPRAPTITQSGSGNIAVQGNQGSVEIGRQITVAAPLQNDWSKTTKYANARFRYSVELPRGWAISGESANSDGTWVHSPHSSVRMTFWGGRQEYENPERCAGYGSEMLVLRDGNEAKLTRSESAGGETWAACRCTNGTCAGIDLELSQRAASDLAAVLVEIVQTLSVRGPPL